MTVFEYIVSGGVLSLIALMFKNNADNDAKVGRVYKRLDEVKKVQEDTYTRKDMCTLLHKQISDDLTEIKVDLKTLVQNGNKYQGDVGIQGPKGLQGEKGDKGDSK